MSALALKTPPGVLGRIVARTLEDLKVRQQAISTRELIDRLDGEPRDLHRALGREGFGLIAEFKPRSPSRGLIRPDATPEDMAAIYGRYAAAISVLCDGPFFGGGLDVLTRIRAEVSQPVLCKDFIVTEYQVFEARVAGADAVLLMASLLPRASLLRLLGLVRELGMSALVEAHDDEELAMVLDSPARIVGVNSRDLHTLQIDTARARRLLATIPGNRVRVAESGVVNAAEADCFRAVANAALVGTAIMGAEDPAAAIEALGFEPCM